MGVVSFSLLLFRFGARTKNARHALEYLAMIIMHADVRVRWHSHGLVAVRESIWEGAANVNNTESGQKKHVCSACASIFVAVGVC